MNLFGLNIKRGSHFYGTYQETHSNPLSYLNGFDGVSHQLLKIVYMVIMNDKKKDKRCKKGH